MGLLKETDVLLCDSGLEDDTNNNNSKNNVRKKLNKAQNAAK